MVSSKDIEEVLNIKIDGEFTISRVSTLKDAKSDELAVLHNRKYIEELSTTNARAVLIDEQFIKDDPSIAECKANLIASKQPYVDLALLSKLFYFSEHYRTDGAEPVIGEGSVIGQNSTISTGVVIGKNVTIFPNAFVGNDVIIGDNSVINANASIYRGCVIGANCIVHSGAVIGADGFGFATRMEDGTHVKLYQNGNVVIEDDVEIGANTCIDRAAFNSTIIMKGTKVDNLVQIGHNCEIGENCMIVSHTGISGSTKFGRNVVTGGQSGFAGHINIAPFSFFLAKSGVANSVKESGYYAGIPAVPRKQWLKQSAILARLAKGKKSKK